VEGSVDLTPEGRLDAARLTRVALGGWLDAPVTIRGRGEGVPPAIALEGGNFDLRRLPRNNRSGGPGRTIEVQLDRLRISDTLSATSVRGELSTRGGLSGQFSARVNGDAPIRATLAPNENGTAIRILSDDAGDVLRSAGIFATSNGGKLDVVLQPRPERGQYNGTLKITENTRVKDAPALAALLSGISIVGLLEQMDGEGLFFAGAEAEFLLTPEALQINRGAATGPSMGISVAGLYTFEDKNLDLQGVISPIYLLNGIGSIFRRGEGLFGFNYRLSGPTSDPRVAVNPLSILSPAMFREIFRRPPPKLPEATE